VILDAHFTDCSLEIETTSINNLCFGDKKGSIILKIDRFLSPLMIDVFNQDNEEIYSETIDDSITNSLRISDLSAGQYSIELTDGLSMTTKLSINITEPQALTVGSTISNYNGYQLSCSSSTDGFIELTPSGGTMPYKQTVWSDGQTGNRIENLAAGNYTYTVSDQNDCIYEGAISLLKPPALSLEVLVSFPDTCNLSDQNISIIAGGGLEPYDIETFNLAGEIIESTSYDAGEYLVQLTDVNNCKLAEPFSIPDQVDINIDLGEDLEININDNLTIIPQSNFDIDHYEWIINPSNNEICKNCEQLELLANEDLLVTLIAYDQNGCDASDSLWIKVKRPPRYYVPNIISLADNDNSRFNIYHSGSIELIDFKIYSRWGELIFNNNNIEVNSPSDGWDGSYLGSMLEQGVYVYFIAFKNENDETIYLNGDITLIR